MHSAVSRRLPWLLLITCIYFTQGVTSRGISASPEQKSHHHHRGSLHGGYWPEPSSKIRCDEERRLLRDLAQGDIGSYRQVMKQLQHKLDEEVGVREALRRFEEGQEAAWLTDDKFNDFLELMQ